MNILVINCGSSSVKFQVIDMASESTVKKGKIERIGEDGLTHDKAVREILDGVWDLNIGAVGHRVVHGGERFTDAVNIDDSVIDEIDARSADAPLHNPYNLAAIRSAQTAFPDIPHVAVFDTAFHAAMPRRARHYAIDSELAEEHRIRRFGFHGPSHQYVSGLVSDALGRSVDELRIVSLHLGNGASACAVEFGHSAETSMGATPLEGLVMGTRAGDVDAGALLGLLRSGKFDTDKLDTLLNRQSGLKGLSGIGNDMREIEEAAADGNDRARLAINVFAHRARKYIGAYAAAMGGLDAVIFTGGIGENSVSMRRRILQRLQFLGLYLDEDRNTDATVDHDNPVARVSQDTSRVDVFVAKTNEELMIARQTHKIAVGSSRIDASQAIPIAVSARHLHLNAETFAQLFGEDAKPTHYKDISQPGQYACEEKVNLIGPRNRIDGVRLLGPFRSNNQIEIARTDEFRLGVDAPIRDSGKTKDSAPITLEGPAGTVHLSEGLICARRHIHMHPDDAAHFGVKDKDVVEVAITGGPRDLVFGDVLIRVSKGYKLEMHIDTDEANAAELSGGATGDLVYEDVQGAAARLRCTRT
ncbi:MAG: acetate/propionate family kinase [Pseudomonadota bacterium]